MCPGGTARRWAPGSSSSAAVVTLLVNQFWPGLFALPQTPHYFALFAWGATFGGFALVVVYLLLSVGSLRAFAAPAHRVSLVVAAVVGIVITAGALFASLFKVTSPTIYPRGWRWRCSPSASPRPSCCAPASPPAPGWPT